MSTREVCQQLTNVPYLVIEGAAFFMYVGVTRIPLSILIAFLEWTIIKLINIVEEMVLERDTGFINAIRLIVAEGRLPLSLKFRE